MGFIRFLVGVALLPLAYAATATLITLLKLPHLTREALFISEAFWLVQGILAWLLIWFFLTKPMRLYVAGHELTHALWALGFGAKVNQLQISAHGGSVKVSKSNLWITLAPYFFPFYTCLVLIIRWSVGLWLQPIPWPFFWMFLLGLTWGFHLCFTLNALSIHQPDILEYGRCFSYIVIYLLNILGICFWLLCSTSITLRDTARIMQHHTRKSYGRVSQALGTLGGCRRAPTTTQASAKPK